MKNSKLMKPFMTVIAASVMVMIAMPATVIAQEDFAAGEKTFSTQIGTLEFNNGYASTETSKLLYDRMDFQRAVQVYLWSLPYVSMRALHEEFVRLGGGKVNALPIFENRLKPNTIVFTGNATTIYGFNTFVMEKDQPVVIDVPPDVLGGINNAWQQPISDVGTPGPDKGNGGKYLIVPPDYEGELPSEGYHVFHSDTYLTFWLMRAFTDGGGNEVAVNKLKKVRVYPLAQEDNPPSMDYIPMTDKGADFGYPITKGYFEMLARGMKEENWREEDKHMHGMMVELGMKPGENLEPDTRMRGILAEAEIVGNAMANNISFTSRDPRRLVWPDREYAYIFIGGEASFAKPTHHMIESRINFTHQAFSSYNSAILKIVGAGSQYFFTARDADGNILDGGERYRLHITKDVPARNFWSLAVYDAGTRSMIDNETGLTQIDTFHNFQRNDDGSVDLYMGPAPPEGKENNWIQTIPGRGFFIYFRLFGPEEEFFDGTWKLADIERVK